MGRRGLVLVAAILAWALSACGVGGADVYPAAGIVAYARIQGSTYVLLADHADSDRGWGAFGGGRKDAETGAATASREFLEETRCVYERPTAADLAGKPNLVVAGFLSYVVEVPYVPPEVFENEPAPPECRGPDFDERGSWTWIPLDDLVVTLENPDSTGVYRLPARLLPEGHTTRLWGASAAVLKEAWAKGYLPE